MQFDDKNKCTFLVKLDLLYEFEEQLFKQDKKRKENRRGILTFCRMQGSITQSYNLLDAQQSDIYKVAREIYYEF